MAVRRALTASRLGAVAAGCSLAAVAAGSAASSALADAAPPPPTAPSDPSVSPPNNSFIPSPFSYAYEKVYDLVVAPYAEPSRDKLLPDIPPQLKGREKPTLVVSLDGTLIESQWSRQFGWRYIKRPGVDEFLAQLAPLYELVLWTDCLSTAETAIDRLDPRRCFRHRLYRDATTYAGGMHRKDLTALNRDLDKVLIIDCDARAFSFQPKHGIAVTKYESEGDPNQKDDQLRRLVPFLAYLAIGRKLGAVTDFSAELQRLGANTSLTNNGEDFEKAVSARFAELRAAGQMPVIQRGGRVALAGAQGSTLWSRMGLGQR